MLFTQPIKKNRAFRQVYSRGRMLSGRYLSLYRLPNGENVNRLGVSVSRKVGNAVVRNRVKRRVQESYRRAEPGLPTGYDLVVVARKAAGQLSLGAAFCEIDRALRGLLKRL